jgi:hypothetical protein
MKCVNCNYIINSDYKCYCYFKSYINPVVLIYNNYYLLSVGPSGLYINTFNTN